jgi:hypothetical protein
MNTETLTKTENLSGIVQALEGAHALIQEKTGAPRATILVTRKTGRTMGHFTHAKVWKSGEDSFQEIMVSANYFERGARAVLGTLLHEVAHSIDLQNGIQGTSGDGYHNKKFKATAESLGLTITQAKGIGWSVTEVSDSCAERWAEALALIENGLALMADAEQGKKAGGRNKNLISARCGCDSIIRLSAKVLEKSAPICQNCGQEFQSIRRNLAPRNRGEGLRVKCPN